MIHEPEHEFHDAKGRIQEILECCVVGNTRAVVEKVYLRIHPPCILFIAICFLFRKESYGNTGYRYFHHKHLCHRHLCCISNEPLGRFTTKTKNKKIKEGH